MMPPTALGETMMAAPSIPRADLRRVVALALDEDIGHGDVTTDAIVPQSLFAEAIVRAKSVGCIAGLAALEAACRALDPRCRVTCLVADGHYVERPPADLARVVGPARAVLTSERVALNLLQHLSGVATMAAANARAVAGTDARILDTRKTTPGLRALEKYAVRVGGGHNHRYGLYDGVLIKDNHIRIAGDVQTAVRQARERVPPLMPIEVEVRTPRELEAAIDAGADIILLDNMDAAALRAAVKRAAERASDGTRPALEASGGVTLATVREIAMTGVDYVSIGALTHSAPALDISLDVVTTGDQAITASVPDDTSPASEDAR